VTARALRVVIGSALALASAAALAALSALPYAAEPADQAVIRLTWRARGERVRACRRLTPAELAKLPPHMRQEEVCERRVLPYRLRVTIDGASVVDELVRAGGAREDRPLFVFRDLAVAPGLHRLEVMFEREEDGGGRAEREREEDERADARQTPRRLALDQPVTLATRRIVLVTYDDEGKRLRLLAAPGGGS